MDEVSQHSGKSPELVLPAAVVLGSILISLAIIFASSGISSQFEKFAASGAGNLAAGAIVQGGAGNAAANNAGNAAAQAPAATGNAPKDAYFLGNPNAKVIVEEFADFQCPYCGAASGLNQEVIGYLKSRNPSYQSPLPGILDKYGEGADSKIKFVYYDFAFLGQESFQAASAAKCAGEQGKYWEYHDKLFSSQKGENEGAFSDANLASFAEGLGLDKAKFQTCLSSQKYLPSVSEHNAYASAKGVRGTPTFFVNGQTAGADFASMDAAIQKALAS